jgi:hypothetical protein
VPLALLLLAAQGFAAIDAPPSRPPPVRGVALGLYSEDPGFSYRPLLSEIARLGANHVELVINVYQSDAHATEITLHTRYSATDLAVARAIREARGVGLAVTLLPIIRLLTPGPGEWRGTLAPRDPARWWRSYTRMILRYATLAAQNGADGLAIGSELATLDGADAHAAWGRLASEVRHAFHGRLLYSANWDHFEHVGLWDLVDAIGLSAYFELASSGRVPSPNWEIASRWRTLRREIEAFAGGAGKPIFFTEVGYLAQRGAAAWPWKEGAAEPTDLEEQRRAYAAFVRTWDGAPALGGVMFWNWYGFGGAASGGYTPRGKPAADEISRWFGAQSY